MPDRDVHGPRRDGGDVPGPESTADSRSEANLNARVRERQRQREIAAACLSWHIVHVLGEGLDGLPQRQRPTCDRLCSAVDQLTLDHWAETLGSCPCPAARRAVGA